MTKRINGDNPSPTSVLMGIIVVLVSLSMDQCCAESHQKVFTMGESTSQRLLSVQDDFPWLDLHGNLDSDEGVGLLSRVRRDANATSGSKSVWEKIEEFYADKNNMAMFCVLPVMILIYGGCSAIYCIYKCRQYMRRRKHKRLKEEDCESLTSDRNDLSVGPKDQPVSQISKAWPDGQRDISERLWSGQTEGKPLGKSSPLPWQSPVVMGAMAAQSMDGRASYPEDSKRDNNMGAYRGNGEKTNNNPYIQPPPPGVRALDPHAFEDSRAHINLADYATNRSSATKATDFSRFCDSRPIEIIPLSADPNLRVWDPLHNRPLRDSNHSRDPRVRLSDDPGSSGARPASVQQMKEDLLARYDALSTLQMAKRAAQILSTNAVEKNPFDNKQNKKKHVFIAE